MEMEPGPIILVTLVILGIGGILFRNFVWDKRKHKNENNKNKPDR